MWNKKPPIIRPKPSNKAEFDAAPAYMHPISTSTPIRSTITPSDLMNSFMGIDFL